MAASGLIWAKFGLFAINQNHMTCRYDLTLPPTGNKQEALGRMFVSFTLNSQCVKMQESQMKDFDVTCWFRDSTNHSSPMKLQAMSTSPLYTKIRYFCKEKTVDKPASSTQTLQPISEVIGV